MSIERLLATIHLTRSILVNEWEIWLASSMARETARDLQRGLRKHRRGVRLLLTWSNISTCPNPELHRQYFYYAGNQSYRCAMCERLQEVC